MTWGAMLRVALSLAGLVYGQIGLKMAMSPHKTRSKKQTGFLFASAIGGMTLWFLLWLGLLQDHQLSYIFPFEGLSSIFLSLGAIFLLKEHFSFRLGCGIVLICLGVFLVALS